MKSIYLLGDCANTVKDIHTDRSIIQWFYRNSCAPKLSRCKCHTVRWAVSLKCWIFHSSHQKTPNL